MNTVLYDGAVLFEQETKLSADCCVVSAEPGDSLDRLSLGGIYDRKRSC